MRREAPFATLPTTPEATIRRLQARRQRIDDHNLGRSFGLPERHARKLRLLAERANRQIWLSKRSRPSKPPTHRPTKRPK
ncbi:hypothetical protein [Tenggerimyces flavus]|uniref:Uncharacterized protein n=1 Tax=Tenggerimyces flavus TaxID=1708749 RepID=A0ABV7YI39_9ACTN|nr:hypothetical protein [Tenggerimyces flavus]MBM7787547.1 hypothetical protein [Tenggerimyces flavus]